MSPQLTALRVQRAKLAAERDAVLAAPERDNRDLTAEESRKFDSMRGRIAKCDLEIIDAEERVTRSGNVDALAARFGQTGGPRDGRSGWSVGHEPATYARGDHHGHSWCRDMLRAGLSNDPDAAQRLRDNNREVATNIRALSIVNAAGGEFSPPLWLMAEYVKVARAARVAANQIKNMPLPPGTDLINLPRIATGTAAAEQAVQNTAVQNTDATTNSIGAVVATIAGQQVISLQLMEQSPLNMDDVLLEDLMADLAQKIDIFTLTSNATSKVGILNVAGANSIVFTSASPTTSLLYSKAAGALNAVQTTRYLPADKWFMHPRRWNWIMAALDTAGRPLVVPNAGQDNNEALNALGTSLGTVDPTGMVGTWLGLPVYVDANLPTNFGAGLNEDRIIALRSSDVILFESTPRAEVFREPYAGQMSVLLRAYSYVAIHASRYPLALAVISGTGMVPPVF